MQIQTKQDHTAVVVVDLQPDFTQAMQGSLAVEGADREYLDLAEAETRRLRALGYPVYATQDWHPANHISFFTNHDRAKPYDVVEIEGRQQILWPPHCVQNTANARILMDESLFTAIVKKGMDPAFDSYSGFFDDGKKETGLTDILKGAGIKTLIVYGLATDYCVRATVMDAKKLGFGVTLIKNLCRGVSPETTAAALEEMEAAGVDIC